MVLSGDDFVAPVEAVAGSKISFFLIASHPFRPDFSGQ